MRIRIDGTNTINKGAELMLYAILNELERFDRNILVEFNMELYDHYSQCRKINTDLNFHILNLWKKALMSVKAINLFSGLKFPEWYMSRYYINIFQPKIDVLFDASGFMFSDQWNIEYNTYKALYNYYQKLYKNNTFMVFLPQSFGPFQTDMGKNVADMLNKFADIIFARDSISYAHLLNAGCDEKKILLFPDFTSTVNGISLEKHRNLKEGVCIIPNKRMIDKGGIDKIKYIEFITTIISEIEEKGKHPFLLNHESIEDSELCSEININLKNKLPIVDNVNSLEVKGIISNSYLTITSRFHGAASALNTGVPCLATSWSHKYEELFRDFKQYDCILDINNINEAINKVTTFLNPIKNIEIRNNILENQKVVGIKNKEMWEIIWRKYSSKK